jgi:hypothetical protein
MGILKPSLRVKVFVGLLYEDYDVLNYAKTRLYKAFGLGDIDIISDEFPFLFSFYYKDIGKNLKRLWFSFSSLTFFDDFYKYKILSNEMEREISAFFGYDSRKINIDPGYLTLSTVYLASTKYAYYRSYIGGGIYLEPEMFFYGGIFRFFSWTYPDYKTYKAINFFYNIREKLKSDIKKE